jgi:hypothetical protein
MEYYVRVKWDGTGGELWDKIAKLMPVVRVGEAFTAKSGKAKTKTEKADAMADKVDRRSLFNGAQLHSPEVKAKAQAQAQAARDLVEQQRKKPIVEALADIMRNHQDATMDFLVAAMNKTQFRPLNVKKWTLGNIKPYYDEAYEMLTSVPVQPIAQPDKGI